jgi:hypothetical protein
MVNNIEVISSRFANAAAELAQRLTETCVPDAKMTRSLKVPALRIVFEAAKALFNRQPSRRALVHRISMESA